METDKLVNLKKYLRYGRIKHLAQRNKIEPQRAWKLLQGAIKATPHDMRFLNACIEEAYAVKARYDMLDERIALFV